MKSGPRTCATQASTFGTRDGPPENRVVVDQVREPVGLRFLFELETRPRTELVEERVDAAVQSVDSFRVDGMFEHEVAVGVEPLTFDGVERCSNQVSHATESFGSAG